MARPKESNLSARARAYEMFVAGMRRAEIARELGVTRATVGNWAKADSWEGRLGALVDTANRTADFHTQDVVAQSLIRLKSQMTKRVAELEALCSPANHPSVRLRAIQLWLKLAGIDKAMPDPIKPQANDLTLVEDLIEEDDNVGRDSDPATQLGPKFSG